MPECGVEHVDLPCIWTADVRVGFVVACPQNGISKERVPGYLSWDMQ